MISTFEGFREIGDLKEFLNAYAKLQEIHVWELDFSLSQELNELTREIFIKSLAFDELLIIDLFEARHHIPISVNKYFNIPTSIVLHDLIPYENPEIYLSHTKDRDVYDEAIVDFTRSDKIFCNSQYTLQSAIKNFPGVSSKIYFIGGGPNSSLKRRNISKINQVLSISGDDSRKNLSRLIVAWSQLPQQILSNYVLKIVGNFSDERIKDYKKEFLGDISFLSSVVFTGQISDSQLEIELNQSIALIHPALSEGLGLPVLEAINVGVPAICSDTSSLKEIAALGAIINPYDHESISAALLLTIQDSKFLSSVIESQKVILDEFNWGQVASTVNKIFIENHLTSRIESGLENLEDETLKSNIAVIAPLSTAKTGIARFANFLHPFLGNLAHVDYIATESLVDLEESVDLLNKYDHVLIHLGNSPHHANAFRLAANFPAIILCHEVKFGNTLKYLYEKEPTWMGELEELFSLKNEIMEIRALHRILNLALGVIVHSESAMALLSYCGIPGNKILKLGHPNLFESSSFEKNVIETEDLEEIVTAGFITPNKGCELIIESIGLYNLRNSKNLRLRMLGEVDPTYGNNLFQKAKESNVQLIISGYLADQDYFRLLGEARTAIQLRIFDSGEASGVVSDLLFFGVPTIVNESSAFDYLPNNILHKLPKEPSADEVSDAIELLQDGRTRKLLSENAKIYSREHASPKNWAETVIDFMRVRYEIDLVKNARGFSELFDLKDVPKFVEVCRILEKNERSFGYKYLIASDISNLQKTEFISGIQRATLEIHQQIRNVLPLNRYICGGFDFESIRNPISLPHSQIMKDPFVANPYSSSDFIDALLLLDLNFDFHKTHDIRLLKDRGIPIVTNVYDVLPITHPEWFPPFTADQFFNPWLNSVIKFSTDIIVNSQSTLEELENLEIFSTFSGTVHVAPLGVPVDFVNQFTIRSKGQTLMVGTIEPRKGHDDVLDAFDALLKQQREVTLHIVGRQGWMVEQIIERIQNHPSFNTQLFWHRNCSDADLRTLYQESEITLVASKGEGFGLPLIEALAQGSQVIARDIPVFREIGNQKVSFFKEDSSDLAEVWSQLLLNNLPTSFEQHIFENNGYVEYAQTLANILKKHFNSDDINP